MPANATMSIRVDADVDRELEIVEGIKKALSNVKAGNVIAHDEVMRETQKIITSRNWPEVGWPA